MNILKIKFLIFMVLFLPVLIYAYWYTWDLNMPQKLTDPHVWGVVTYLMSIGCAYLWWIRKDGWWK